jgi:hypothetical protein
MLLPLLAGTLIGQAERDAAAALEPDLPDSVDVQGAHTHRDTQTCTHTHTNRHTHTHTYTHTHTHTHTRTHRVDPPAVA